MILLPPTLIFQVIFFPTVMIFPSQLYILHQQNFLTPPLYTPAPSGILMDNVVTLSPSEMLEVRTKSPRLIQTFFLKKIFIGLYRISGHFVLYHDGRPKRLLIKECELRITNFVVQTFSIS